eukprot:GHVP01005489.1.p1 GENE.GHVP01005489.1~~GHVP01005489.1.p1  ORF type:complete len:426 (-),score=57.97 GHVP01005489.1:195-1472(-)
MDTRTKRIVRYFLRPEQLKILVWDIYGGKDARKLDFSGIEPQNIETLKKYSEVFPSKMSALTDFLVKCIKEDLKKNHSNAVLCGSIAVAEILRFSPYAFYSSFPVTQSLIDRLLQDKHPKHQEGGLAILAAAVQLELHHRFAHSNQDLTPYIISLHDWATCCLMQIEAHSNRSLSLGLACFEGLLSHSPRSYEILQKAGIMLAIEIIKSPIFETFIEKVGDPKIPNEFLSQASSSSSSSSSSSNLSDSSLSSSSSHPSSFYSSRPHASYKLSSNRETIYSSSFELASVRALIDDTLSFLQSAAYATRNEVELRDSVLRVIWGDLKVGKKAFEILPFILSNIAFHMKHRDQEFLDQTNCLLRYCKNDQEQSIWLRSYISCLNTVESSWFYIVSSKESILSASKTQITNPQTFAELEVKHFVPILLR